MSFLFRRVVKLTMEYSCSRTHSLDVARTDDRTGSHAVFMLERTFDHIGDNLHVLVPMLSKALTWFYVIFIDDQQIAKTGEFWVVIVGERKSMIALEPTVSCMAS